MKKSFSLLILIISTIIIPHFAHADVLSGLTAWYKFDEGSGTTAADSSGNGYTGTFVNSPSWITGRVGPSAITTDINVTGDVGSRVTTASIPLGATWTTSWWTNFPLSSNGSYRTMFRSFSPSSDDHQVLVDPTGELGMYDNDGATAFHGTGYNVSSISPGWHFMTVIGSGTTEKFYVDTVLVGTTDLKSDDVIDSIGNYTDHQTWGSIDDLRIYSRALSSTEINQLYVGRQTPSAKFIVSVGHKIKVSVGRLFGVKYSFSPAQIPGLSLWLKPETLGTGSVSSWTDSSGSGNSAVQASGSMQPTVQTSAVNGYSAVRFDGSDDYLDSPLHLGTTGSAFIVSKLDRALPVSGTRIDTVVANRQFLVTTPRQGFAAYLTNGFADPSQTFAGIDDNGAGASTYINGTVPGNAVGDYPSNAFAVMSSSMASLTSSSENYWIGGVNYSDGYANADVAEVLIYNSALSKRDRQAVEDYLGRKYNITITH